MSVVRLLLLNSVALQSWLTETTYIQAMWTIHGIPPQGIIVSCRLTDNMAQGIHLQRTQQEVKLVNILRYRNTCKHQHSDVW